MNAAVMDQDQVSSESSPQANVGKAARNAGMACEACRGRKTRCDQHRPRCGFCEKHDLSCVYREAKPTKKDKTLEYILATLENINLKLDQFGNNTPQIREYMSPVLQPSPMAESEPPPSSINASSKSATEGQKLLSWPAVQSLLECDIDQLKHWDGLELPSEKWLLQVTEDFGIEEPYYEPVKLSYSEFSVLQTSSRHHLIVTEEQTAELCAAYFSSLHCIYPIIDRSMFFDELLPRVCSNSFGAEDEASCLVLMVLALGAVAKEGTIGTPVRNPENGRETGILGGSAQNSPGVEFFCEAKRRLGINMARFTLITQQSHLLIAIYYAQCSRNLEYWHVTELSCIICRNLVKMTDTWASPVGDMVARCYWMCVLLETGPTGELGMKRTGITQFQESIPLPLFLSTSKSDKSNDDIFREYHFLAQVSLGTLLLRINDSLRTFRDPSRNSGTAIYPPNTLVRELWSQLQNWRDHLPTPLRWNDGDTLQAEEDYPKMVNVCHEGGSYKMLHPNLVLEASLRTRYQYVRYLIWRPYIFKALHSPSIITEYDLYGCEQAFQACSLWPLTLPVFQRRKRIVPHLYEYSNTLFGVLILLHVSSSCKALEPLLKRFSDQIESSKHLYLEWLQDM